MAWTTPTTVSDGQTISASLWNQQVRDNLDFLYAPAVTIAARNTSQTISRTTTTKVSFDTEVIDSVGGFAPTSDTITCKESGLYLISYSFYISNGASIIQMGLAFNGSATPDQTTVKEVQVGGPSANWWLNGEFVKQLNNTDTVSLTAYFSGGPPGLPLNAGKLGLISLGRL